MGVEALFLGLLFLCVVGVDPFGGGAGRSGLDDGRASGNAIRQLLHMIIFSATLLAALRYRVSLFSLLPNPGILIFVFWCGLSVSWALLPEVSLRRFTLMAIVLFSVQAQVLLIGPDRALTLLVQILAAVLLINLVSIPIVEQARHLPGEDLGLDGDWRGVFLHKNQAGAVTAATTLLLIARLGRGVFVPVLLVLSLFFLIMTGSKTAIGLTLIAGLIAALFRICVDSHVGRVLLISLIFWGIGVGVALLLHMSEPISELFRDPTAFTGRMALWMSLWDMVQSDPMFGTGYGSFWNLGSNSPISGLVHPDHWTAQTGQGHNGYLDLLVMVGVPGLLFALAGFLLPPLRAIAPLTKARPAIAALLLSVTILLMGVNTMESFIAQGDTGFWVLFVTITLIGIRMSRSALLDADPFHHPLSRSI